jgi:hypothetical protein
MVPGFTERDCLAADLQRREWLAEANASASLDSQSADARKRAMSERPCLPLGAWRRSLSSVRNLGQRIRLGQMATGDAAAEQAAAPIRS